MATLIETIYEKGVLRPLKPLVMPENMRVTVLLPDDFVGTPEPDEESRPWRGLFVPDPPLKDERVAAYLRAIPTQKILPETPKINLSWLRNHPDGDE